MRFVSADEAGNKALYVYTEEECMSYLTKEEFEDWVSDEGGIYELVHHGINEGDIPKDSLDRLEQLVRDLDTEYELVLMQLPSNKD